MGWFKIVNLENEIFDEEIAKHLGQTNATDKVITEFTSEFLEKDVSKSNIDFKTLLNDDEIRLISRIETIGKFLQQPMTFKERWVGVEFTNRIKRLMTSRDGKSREQITRIFAGAMENEQKHKNDMLNIMRSRDQII